MKLRVTVARLLLLPVLAMGATTGALAVDSPFAVFKKIVLLPKTESEEAVGEFNISSKRQFVQERGQAVQGPSLF